MPPTLDLNARLKIAEIFVSLQGEGPTMGCPAFFIRLAGCNLNCRWCDTPQARNPQEGKLYTVSSLLKAYRESGLSQVLITGGEPLLQEGVYPLMEALLRQGARVILETNGSLSLARVPPEVIKVMDLKTPSSGMSDRMCYENLRYLGKNDCLKFVIAGEEDYQWAREKVFSLGLFYFTEVLFSPAWGEMPPQKLAHLILQDGLPVRLQIQLHKFLGLP